ncbi:MAG: outer membrane protein assembly factor BamB family protein [Planctomycetota bacterium]|jgi:outer membrane protein assembly factor BamB
MQSKARKLLQAINFIKHFKISQAFFAVCLMILFSFSAQKACAADWPMWRYDAAHTAASPEELPAELHLQWVRKLAKPRPAWPPWQYKLQFDRSYEPVVMGKMLFVSSMVSDRVTAYDTDTGKEKWRFYSDAPVRFAPVADKGKIYFVSDDGYLYCLNAKTGSLIWKFRGGPSDRKVLGNERLISTWPARGAPVLFDGKIYFTASIWPFMGIFIYAIDAETGELIWANSATGSIYIKQPHNSPAFAGVAPQGYLAATEDKFLVPGGRSVPACYDRKTGQLLYYHAETSYGKGIGGYDVAVSKDFFFNNSVIYSLSDGRGLARASAPVLSDNALIGFDGACTLIGYTAEKTEKQKSKKSKDRIKTRGLWKISVPQELTKIHLKAGSRIYCSGKDGLIAAVNIPGSNHQPGVSWQTKVEGQLWNMLAADGKLFAVTLDGSIYCFGAEKTQPKTYPLTIENSIPDDTWSQKVETILKTTGLRNGYCVVLGLANSGRLAEELVKRSNLHVIVLDTSKSKVQAFRRRMDNVGFYGRRIASLTGDITSIQLPPYLADLIIAEDLTTVGFNKGKIFAERLFYSLRPYGGTAYLNTPQDKQFAFARQAENTNPLGGRIEIYNKSILLKRVGSLPGSADWTGQYGNIANTVCSKDKLVKAPLGLLWFGDRSGFGDVLPRHGHGPPEQVVAGRLFIEGVNSINARDVYTGRTLWKRDFDNLNTFGVYYDHTYKPDYLDRSYNQVHIPGANVRGTNFVATSELVYVISGQNCLVLDAATGKTVQTISMPAPNDKDQWGYIGVYEDLLIAGSGFVEFTKLLGKTNNKEEAKWLNFYDKLAGKRLVVMNRHTGDMLWQMDAKHGFIHNTIIAGKGKIFCLDKLPSYIEEQLTERRTQPQKEYRLLALDAHTGKTLWQKNDNIFGAWLGYSAQYDILLQADRPSGDMLSEPGDRMITYRGRDGTVLWDRSIDYRGPCMLHRDTIITQSEAFSLLTGQPKMRLHPLTGRQTKWSFSRNYGCNTAIASEHLLTFRSAAAGYFDLAGDGGTGNIGGFKSGCTSNLVVANGVLNAPDYTQTCTCSYQNQTSLALVYTPQAEMWTFNAIEPNSTPVRRVGINFAAPGDRKAKNGTLWLDYPSLGGKSPDIPIQITPEKPNWFRRHSSVVEAGKLKWVTAPGARGISNINIKLGNRQQRQYTVRLYFIEPDAKDRGERIFNVGLQGKFVLKGLDIIKETGSANVGLVKEFSQINAADTLSLTLTPADSAPSSETIICGIEIIADRS